MSARFFVSFALLISPIAAWLSDPAIAFPSIEEGSPYFPRQESAYGDYEKVQLRMPKVKVTQNETYLCTAFPVPEDVTYLLSFKALASASHIHHVLVFGCDEPGQSMSDVWDCGDMHRARSDYVEAPVCNGNNEILYAWGKDAPETRLPPGTGFRVGQATSSKNVIVQVHYMHPEEADESGVEVEATTVEQPRTAATLLIVTDGIVRPQAKTRLEAACVIDEPVFMHPVAFRVHAHDRGLSVAGYAVARDPSTGEDHWELLGERNPQLPQMFAPVNNSSLIIEPGDVVAARCIFENKGNSLIRVGSTGADEMCNFYLTYYVEGSKPLSDNICYSPGAPKYTWKQSTDLNNIPTN